jgi:hypothetical protein
MSMERAKITARALGCLLALAEATAPIGAQTLSDPPRPLPRPERPAVHAPAEVLQADEVPRPLPRPEPPRSDGAKPKAAEPRPAEPPATVPSVMPAAEQSCRARLQAMGAVLRDTPRLSDPTGCSVPFPVELSKLPEGVELQPPAVLNCETAERFATFVAQTLAPMAVAEFGVPLAAIRQDSGYVCRARSTGAKLSEHAYGNAIDLGAFHLSDGMTVTVGSAAGERQAGFLLAVRLAACGPFTTVLGPGSDADHASHLHFDLAKRRNGSLFCQ